MFANLQQDDARNGYLYKCQTYNEIDATTKSRNFSRITVKHVPSMFGVNFCTFFSAVPYTNI